jgi:hypothetical protein
MSRGGGGTYTLPAGNPVVTGTTITSTWANTTLTDIATALTDSLSRSGLGGMTAALLGTDGTAAAPAYSFTSEPDTGLYLFGPNQLGFATGGVFRGRIESSGGWFIPAPTSGGSFTITAITGNEATQWTDGTVQLTAALDGSPAGLFGTASNHPLILRTNAGTRITVAAAGNVTVAAPSSGVHTINGLGAPGSLSLSIPAAGTGDFQISDATRTAYLGIFPTGGYVGTRTNHPIGIYSNNAERVLIAAAGNVTINAPSSGQTLTVNATSATGSGLLALGNTTIGTDNTSQVRFNNITAASASAGGGAALPATILGYLTVNVNATQVKIPYYAV